MHLWKTLVLQFLKILAFWILVFHFQRILFTIHNLPKFENVGFWEYLGAYVYSLRLDLASASFLSILPILPLILYTVFLKKSAFSIFKIIMIIEIILIACLHAGEINAYTEWNHKLTSRVFTHLLNPDEVVRTADYGMTIWFFIYATLEVVFGIKLLRLIFKKQAHLKVKIWLGAIYSTLSFALFLALFGLMMRGGTQQIPINIDSAYYSKNYVANDLSVNSLYFFGKSLLLYRRSDIDHLMPDLDAKKAALRTKELFTYPSQHENYILENKRPNLVFIILESWSANAIASLNGDQVTTPHFDQMTKEGILFTNFYATGGTSEIGNASIFSGYPAIPEISLSMQPDKHRKLSCLNEDLEKWGYSTNYVFSGDLKYGNIGGFFTDHGFDVVLDENDFPKSLPKGKLNYFDPALYDFLMQRIEKTKEPFLHCAFTGSTHSPYDHPKKGFTKFKGEEADFLNSLSYADQALHDFLEKCKTKSWYENTLFVLVADHGHATPKELHSANSQYYRIPLLLWGPALKENFRGIKNQKTLCQTDIPATLLYQMGGDLSRYPWSRDMMNPDCPEFVLHTIQSGYGYVVPKGNFTFVMDTKTFLEKNLPEKEILDGKSFLLTIYNHYKSL